MKIKLLKQWCFAFVVLCGSLLQAQTVTGKVTADNQPLPGANISIKGTANGTQTDFDGGYVLENVPSNATLVISYVGFVTQEILVEGKSIINIAFTCCRHWANITR